MQGIAPQIQLLHQLLDNKEKPPKDQELKSAITALRKTSGSKCKKALQPLAESIKGIADAMAKLKEFRQTVTSSRTGKLSGESIMELVQGLEEIWKKLPKPVALKTLMHVELPSLWVQIWVGHVLSISAFPLYYCK